MTLPRQSSEAIGTPCHSLTAFKTACLQPLNPKVQGSTPCASTTSFSTTSFRRALSSVLSERLRLFLLLGSQLKLGILCKVAFDISSDNLAAANRLEFSWLIRNVEDHKSASRIVTPAADMPTK